MPSAALAAPLDLGLSGLSLPALSIGPDAAAPAPLPETAQAALSDAAVAPALEALPNRTAAPARDAEAAPAPKESFPAKVAQLGREIRARAPEASARAQQGSVAAAAQFSALTGERLAHSDGDSAAAPAPGSQDPLSASLLEPSLSDADKERTGEVNQAVVAAAASALSGLIPGGPEVVSRGSTARMTHSGLERDYDLTVVLPASWTGDDAARLLSRPTRKQRRKGQINEVQASLHETFSRTAAALFPGASPIVFVSRRKPMARPTETPTGAGVRWDSSAWLMTIEATDGRTGDRLIKVDLLFTNDAYYLNDYPAKFDRQLAGLREAAGPDSAERTMHQVRLAKRFFREVLGYYKYFQGGPSGVGVEQMVLQSAGLREDGVTPSGEGSLEKVFANVLRAAYDDAGALRAWPEAAKNWLVRNPSGAGVSNFSKLLSPRAWNALVRSALRYFELRATGRPFALEALKPGNGGAPQIRPAAAPAPTPKAMAAGDETGRLTLGLLERFTASGPAPSARGDAFLLAQGAKTLPAGLTAPSGASEISYEGEPLPERGILQRRGGDVLLKPMDDPNAKPVPLPAGAGRGLPSGTLVTLARTEKTLTVTPVGALPQDVTVGRVAKRGDAWVLEPLLELNDLPLTLWGELPLKAAQTPVEGRILEAYVHSEGGALAAVPLADLGSAVTPEAVALDSALRHGARAYFPADVIRQIEARVQRDDPHAEFDRARERLRDAGRPAPLDLTDKPFWTMDPPGAGDLDDASYIITHPDGSVTWYLATALIGSYVGPGTPAFRHAARQGNTTYSIDKNGTPEYPMNHPAVSKYAASLLPGKPSLAMITTMHFDRDKRLVPEKSSVDLGLIEVRGRYTYDAIRDVWAKKAPPVEHQDQIDQARALAAALGAQDDARGKLEIDIPETSAHKGADGQWKVRVDPKDALLDEAHHVVEELKVYGNRVIARTLEDISRSGRVEHLSRVHPPQDPRSSREYNLRRQLEAIGFPWPPEEPLAVYLKRVRESRLSPQAKELAQFLALISRNKAVYTPLDLDGHEGLALQAGQYDHPSAGIRRFADMYNLVILDAYLKGLPADRAYRAMLQDLSDMGFAGLEEFAQHLNARERAAGEMDREVERFMSIYELARPENQNRGLRGYVRYVGTRDGRATIQLEDPRVSVELDGPEVENLKLLQKVTITVRGVDVARMSLDYTLKPGPAPQRREDNRGRNGNSGKKGRKRRR
jgi:exoribonuclease R